MTFSLLNEDCTQVRTVTLRCSSSAMALLACLSGSTKFALTSGQIRTGFSMAMVQLGNSRANMAGVIGLASRCRAYGSSDLCCGAVRGESPNSLLR